MICNLSDFTLEKVWIILTAGKKDTRYKNSTKREAQILKSLVSYVKENNPDGVLPIYGQVADILLYTEECLLKYIPGIGQASLIRIKEIREYLKGKDTYKWLYNKSNDVHKKEVPKLASFGDAKEEKKEERLDKEYRVVVNGYLSTVEPKEMGYLTKEFSLNLTREEYHGIKKLFDILETNGFQYVTGMGVYSKNV